MWRDEKQVNEIEKTKSRYYLAAEEERRQRKRGGVRRWKRNLRWRERTSGGREE
jgi:hypothetical protein